jgi:hypothetical protein
VTRRTACWGLESHLDPGLVPDLEPTSTRASTRAISSPDREAGAGYS